MELAPVYLSGLPRPSWTRVDVSWGMFHCPSDKTSPLEDILYARPEWRTCPRCPFVADLFLRSHEYIVVGRRTRSHLFLNFLPFANLSCICLVANLLLKPAD